ncbi:MAG: cell wall-active antibiotics response protein [Treponema sp.]|jgi:hypothetical protein|nr:cell wall-active antibiotics response protein [Treponema sp.]
MESAVEVKENRKNQIIEKLSTYYSLNYMSLEEYERLAAYSNNIETDKELDILENIIESSCSSEKPGENQNHESGASSALDDQRLYYTILSSRKTSGSILKKENIKIINILGEHQIILSENDLTRNETVIDVMSLLGNVIVRVPDNVEVICRVIPLLGDISMKDDDEYKGNKKKLIITGNTILGSISIKKQKNSRFSFFQKN